MTTALKLRNKNIRRVPGSLKLSIAQRIDKTKL